MQKLENIIIKSKFFAILIIYTLLFCLVTQTSASDIDLQSAMNMLQRARSHSGYNLDQTQKCLFPYISTITDNWKNIPPLMRQEIGAMFQRPDDPQSFWYVAGLPKIYNTPHFKFHYTTEGPDAVISGDTNPPNGIPDLIDI